MPDLTPSRDKILLPERSKAINFVCWYRGCYQEPSVENILLTIQNMGANIIQIVTTWYQDHLNSSEINEHTNRGRSVEEIRSLTEMNPSDQNPMIFFAYVCG